jgi:type II secretory pathway pseudopilin PulG
MEKNKKNSYGFTIIELLIVIAILGVLAAIVLINVTGYINKGKDAAAKGDLGTLLTNAITFYNENSTFDDVGAATNIDYNNALDALESTKMGYTVTVTCNGTSGSCGEGDGSQKWCAAIKEASPSASTYYCVDSSGAKKEKESLTVNCAAGVCTD